MGGGGGGPQEQQRDASGLVSLLEVRLTLELLRGLHGAGLDLGGRGGGVAVISPYRLQVSALKAAVFGAARPGDGSGSALGTGRAGPGAGLGAGLGAGAGSGALPNPSASAPPSQSLPLSACFDVSGVHVSTVDRFQGSDCEVVVFSLVRSAGGADGGEGFGAGDLLRDW